MKALLNRSQLPLLATIIAFVVLFATVSIRHESFFSYATIVNLLTDNAVLGLTAIGMTLVILSGGIDLSVGAVAAFTSMVVALLISSHDWHPAAAFALMLPAGALFGAAQGALIERFEMPAFLVTLGGMFLARGVGLMISQASIGVNHPLYDTFGDFSFDVFPIPAIALLVGIVTGIFVLRYTSFGRNIYALGGSEQSAQLMGLPVRRTKVLVYTVSGFCSALAGVVSTIYNSSGHATSLEGLELEAIAVAVIGGTPLTGGIGGVLGTLFGLLIFGTIQTMTNYEPWLDSALAKIFVGVLLLLFIIGQKLLHFRSGR